MRYSRLKHAAPLFTPTFEFWANGSCVCQEYKWRAVREQTAPPFLHAAAFSSVAVCSTGSVDVAAKLVSGSGMDGWDIFVPAGPPAHRRPLFTPRVGG